MLRYRLFEIWRFGAALLVTLYHFGHFAPESGLWVKNELELLRPLLDMFFVISGFLIFARYGDEVRDLRSYGTYLVKRLVRLYPLHLVTLSYFVLLGVAVALGIFSTGGEPQLFQWDTLINHLLLIQAWGVQDDLTFNFVSWSLSAEWFAYLLLPLIIVTWSKEGPAGLFALLLFAYTMLEAMAGSGLAPFEHWLFADSWGAYRVFADFVLGAFVWALVDRCPWTVTSRTLAWIALFAACTSMMLQMNVYLTMTLLGGAILLAGLVERNDPNKYTYPAFLRPAAAVSFGIYLWHPVTESLFLTYFWRKYIDLSSSTVFFGYTAVVMLLTIFIAIASFHFFESKVSGTLLRALGLIKPRPSSAISG